MRSLPGSLLSIVVIGGCQQTEPPLRFAVTTFSHETCTFCPGGDVTIEDWTRRPPQRGEDLLRSGGYIGGFVARAREYGDVELIGLESPQGVYGGSSRSWSTRETFEHFMERIIADLREALPVDGVFLALHGAMAVREIPRPEAEIARRVREVVGPEVPIAATFDLHGNEDEEFLRWADMAFVTKRYPHYDAYLQGERAARMLVRTARGEFRPTTATRKPPVITATVLQWTGQSPSMDIMERARRWEAREPDAYVSVFYGFPWSDVPDVGATVMVVTNDDQELADRIADDMADFIWRVREDFAVGGYPQPVEAVRLVRQAVRAGQTPVALADHSDRNGDATHVLRTLISQGVSRVLVGTIRDEHVLAALAEGGAEVGDAFSMEIGGFAGPSSGTPVRIDGTLIYFDEWGREDYVAAVEFGDHNVVVITPTLSQITDPYRLQFGPIRVDDFDVFVVKSRVHFRRGFDETGFAKTILIVEAPGPYVGTTALDALGYEHAPIDRLYPFGDAEWR
ncbi:MAG: M81 family metallopeptidase [Gemmatimonadales bacterium]|jgi:microcystin degradation protein MlrC